MFSICLRNVWFQRSLFNLQLANNNIFILVFFEELMRWIIFCEKKVQRRKI